MLKNILAITGKPGLYKLLSRGNNTLIVESLVDGKRMPTFARDKIVSLAEVSMYTTEEDASLSDVLNAIGKKNAFAAETLDAKKATNEELRAFLKEVLPNFDEDRVYPSDIRKLISWYNLLITAGFTDFTLQEEESEEHQPSAGNQPSANSRQSAAKAQQPAAKASAKAKTGAGAKTGVGAKKG